MEKALRASLTLPPEIHTLCLKELEVLFLVSQGMNSKDIAVKLDVAPKSVDNYKNRIAGKLGLKGYQVLARYVCANRDDLQAWMRIVLFPRSPELRAQYASFSRMTPEGMEAIQGGAGGRHPFSL